MDHMTNASTRRSIRQLNIIINTAPNTVLNLSLVENYNEGLSFAKGTQNRSNHVLSAGERLSERAS
jgi:hypothetical protein